jgi:hypothetical protein
MNNEEVFYPFPYLYLDLFQDRYLYLHQYLVTLSQVTKNTGKNWSNKSAVQANYTAKLGGYSAKADAPVALLTGTGKKGSYETWRP